MTDLAFSLTARPMAAPAVWSGRILSGVIGGFLSAEGLTRLVTGRALVAPSETAPALAPLIQTGLGGALIGGAVLLMSSRTRLIGGAFLTLCLMVLVAAETFAPTPSPGHILFQVYVALLLWTGCALRQIRFR